MLSTSVWCLLTVQLVMGAFDIVYHHEFTERLPWRLSQKTELLLHGIRNLFYAGLFLVFGFLDLSGFWAGLLIAVLLSEIIITLIDFVEEDRTRKLPATERVLHTVLAINYGAIIALLVPELAVRAMQPTEVSMITQGFWSVMTLVAAIGVTLCGVRDMLASRRLAHMARLHRALELPDLSGRQHVLVTGGTGFVGRRLVEALVHAGHDVTVLVRETSNLDGLPRPLRLITHLDQIAGDERIDAVVNLAGEPIFGWLWTARYRRKLLRSRLRVTRQLIHLMGRLEIPPRVFISGSAVGIYGPETGRRVDEHSDVVSQGSFSERLCALWEAEARKAEIFGVRTVRLRTGIVLDPAGGTLGQLLFPFEFFLGGTLGHGTQHMSWITRDDLVRLIVHIMRDERLQGPVNGVTPRAETNAVFTAALAHALHRPAYLPVPHAVLAHGLGDLGREIFLADQQVYPSKALRTGFRFQSPTLETAFARMFGAKARSRSDTLHGEKLSLGA